MLQWGPLSRFHILPPEDKEEVLNVVLPLVDEAFEDVGSGVGAWPAGRLDLGRSVGEPPPRRALRADP